MRFTIFNMPPPASSLYLTNAIFGSIPVVSLSLVKVTEDAGPREIFHSTFAPVFFRNDVLDMKVLQVHRKIGQAAIFTPSACPAPANLTSAGGHRVDRFR